MEGLTDKKTKWWFSLMKFGARMGCHQMNERSFSYKGYQFPLCARCTGVLLGEALSIVTILCSVRISLLVAIALAFPLAVDGGLQYMKILKSNNLRRIVTGVLAGFGLTYVYFYILVFIVRTLTNLFNI